MEKQNKKIYGGAIVLSIGAFISKLIGAIYRPILTNIIGSVGLGIYQMVFPVYVTLLDFSGSGVPNALSKLISSIEKEVQKEKAQKYLKVCLKTFSILGFIGSLLMAIFCKPFSILQGNEKAWLSYLTLSPSVFLVSVICCYRGFFQGQMEMKPTAVSQIVEQIVKLFIGLFLAFLLSFSVFYSTAGTTFGITLAEFFALLYLIVRYKKISNGVKLKSIGIEKSEKKFIRKNVIRLVIPVTLIGVIIPFSQIIDSFFALNLMSKYMENATGVYGLFSGAVMSIVGLPVAVCYGIAVVSVPAVSSAKATQKEQRAKKVILITFIASLIFAVFCFIFANFSVNLLFHSLPISEKQTAVKLLKLCSPCIVLLSLIQTQNSVLIGLNRPYLAIISLMVGVIIKEILNYFLLSIPTINIYGLGISVIACYFLCCLINLISLTFGRNKNENTRDKFRKYTT